MSSPGCHPNSGCPPVLLRRPTRSSTETKNPRPDARRPPAPRYGEAGRPSGNSPRAFHHRIVGCPRRRTGVHAILDHHPVRKDSTIMETPFPENVPPPLMPPPLAPTPLMPPQLVPASGPATGESASIKITLAELKWLLGLDSITFLLDGQPLKPIPIGGTGVFGVSPGQHTIQTILKSSSWLYLYIPITRRSAILTVSVAPNTQVAVMARYNRAWGKFELHAS